MNMISRFILAAALSALALSAAAQIKVGVILSTTGPAASLGIPEKNTVSLYPSMIAGQKVEYIVLDDASDTTNARRNAEKLVSESKVDVIIGSTLSPNSLAFLEIAAKSETPAISLGASRRIVAPMDEQRKWMFKTPYDDAIIAEASVLHMVKKGIKRLGHIGQNDSYGEGWYQALAAAAEKHGVKIVVSEKYNRTDTSVSSQVLRLIAANPEAIMIVGAGTPAVLPHASLVERGYKGQIYQTAGVINNDFLRVGGKNVEGTVLPSGPVVVVDELDNAHPAKKPGDEYKRKYDAAFGAGTVTTFGANAWDAMLMVQQAVPGALAKGKPGMPEFRRALRDGLEALKGLPATHGIMNMTPTEHMGFATSDPVMITIRNGKWALAK